jgi:hypothetical protein
MPLSPCEVRDCPHPDGPRAYVEVEDRTVQVVCAAHLHHLLTHEPTRVTRWRWLDPPAPPDAAPVPG